MTKHCAATHTFGALLYSHRTARGESQAEVGRKVDLTGAYVSALENERRPPPPDRTVVQLARALAMTESEQRDLFLAAHSGRRPRLKLPEEISRLVATLKRAGPQLPAWVVREFEVRIRELGLGQT